MVGSPSVDDHGNRNDSYIDSIARCFIFSEERALHGVQHSFPSGLGGQYISSRNREVEGCGDDE